VISTTAVAWTDQTALGSPEALFSPFAGTCQATFSWDGSGWSSLNVEPLQGQSTLTATVVLDPSSARWVTRGSAWPCTDELRLDGTVTLELPEGNVANQHPVTMSVGEGVVPTSMSFALDESEFGPWVSIQKTDQNASLGMSIELGAVAQACSGRILLSYEARFDGGGTGATGPLASWSNTGCGVRQFAVNLAEPGQGVDLASAVSAAFDQVTLSGTWGDGSATALSLATSLPETEVCAETLPYGTVVTVPVDVVASTADDRVRGLSGRDHVRATLNQGSVSELQLLLSTDLVCESEADTLAYALADCATVSKVTAQLIYTRRGDPTDGGRLELYVYDRQNPGTGGANRVDRLELDP
jgi:hypothetical protein